MPPRISTRRRIRTVSCASEPSSLAPGSLCIKLREAKMRAVLLASIAFGLVGSSAAAQDRKGIRFWNLTLYTITTFQMSPAGKDDWGPDQCKNDRDGTVDHDERLRIMGIEPGRYDVKLGDKIGRVCVVRNVEVKDGPVFSIQERQLTVVRMLSPSSPQNLRWVRANDRPPIFAHHLSSQPIDCEAAAIGIRLQAPPTPWQRGWRLHPSRPAKGSRRVRDAAPSIATGPRP